MTYEQYVAEYRREHLTTRVMLSRTEWLRQQPLALKMLLMSGSDLELEVPAGTHPCCPVCGNDDLGAWADDGEADLADWWDCTNCGTYGAFLHPMLSHVTQNGIPLTGYSPLPAA